MKAEFLEDWSPLGAHFYRFEQPDLFIVRIVGDVSLSDTEALFDRLEKVHAQVGGPLFWMTDVSGLGQVAQAARQLAVQRDPATFLRGVTIYGGSFHQRLFANMLMKAVVLLRRHRRWNPMLFCATEAEARAFVEQERLRAQSSSSS